MHKRYSLIFGFAMMVGTATQAGTLVELFTSQGCSSCPPADAFLQELGEDDNHVALAFHVDYWDYLGHPDQFADPLFGQRQLTYAAKRNSKRVFTPNMVVGGTLSYIGADVAGVYEGIDQLQTGESFTTETKETATAFELTIRANPNLRGDYDLVVAKTLPPQTVAIGAGENAGRTLTYTHVVDSIEVIGNWQGEDDLRVDIPKVEGRSLVFFVQEHGLGAVPFALKLGQ